MNRGIGLRIKSPGALKTVYDIAAGWGVTTGIVSASTFVGMVAVGPVKGAMIGMVVGSIGSCGMGIWLARKPGWNVTGVAQALFTVFPLLTGIAMSRLSLKSHGEEMPGGLKYLAAVVPTPLFAMQKARAKQMSYRVQPRSAQIRS